MDITVAICTYNRAGILRATLESFLAMAFPHGFDSEVLVVDNNSADDTPGVTRAFQEKFPGRFRYCHEPEQGLSAARNRAFKESDTPLISYVDDDVYFDPNWLVAIKDAFAAFPQVASVGGRIRPVFEGAQPAWDPGNLLGYFGNFDLGDRYAEIVWPRYPFGCNMAFRREVFAAIGGFSKMLGRQGDNLLSNEEREFFGRAFDAGLRAVYAPRALILHRIPASRTTARWILRRVYWQGRSDVELEASASATSLYPPLRRARWEVQKALADLMSLGPRSFPDGIAHWHSIRRWAHRAYLMGRARQLWQRRHEPHSRR